MSHLEAFLGQSRAEPEPRGTIVSYVASVTAILLGLGLLLGGFFLKSYSEQDAKIYSASATATVLPGARTEGAEGAVVCTLEYSFKSSSGKSVKSEAAELGSCTKIQDAGAERAVYYDPQHPQVSTLTDPMESQDGSWIYLTGPGIVVGIAGIVSFVVLRLRRPAHPEATRP